MSEANDRILHLEKAIDRAAEPLAPVPDIPIDPPEPLDKPAATIPDAETSEPETLAPSQDAAAATPATGEDDTEASAPPDGIDTPARQNKGVGKRINELTREKYEAQRRADALAAEAAHWKQLVESQTQAQQPAAQSGEEPTFESCGWDAAVFTAKTKEWAQRNAEASIQQRQVQASEEQSVRTYNERAAKFADAHPDYQEKLEAVPIPIPPAMARVLRDSDMGPQVAYHLADHLDELATLVKLPPLAIAKAIGKLEDKLSTPPPKSPVSPVTRAPAPPKTLQGTGFVGKDLTTMTVEDHLAELKAKRQQR